MKINIPDFKELNIKNLICDFNGTIAKNGKLIDGVSEQINKLAEQINIYVITADTFGTVEEQLKNVNCKILKIKNNNQAQQKLDLLIELNPSNTVCFGNGRNDELMLLNAVIGIGILEAEGIYAKNLLSADIICKSISNAFELFLTPNKLIATLRN